MIVWSIIPLANGEPFLEGAYPYLKVAVDWAQTLGLKVSTLAPTNGKGIMIGHDRSTWCSWISEWI
jgi:hypothetical protein